MADKPPEEKKKGLLGRIKAGLDDKEEQVSFISMITRLVVLGWSGFLLTLAYVDLPESILPKQDMDPTFIASIFVSTLTTFGIDANQKGNGKKKDKDNMESSGGYQVIRVETPIKIIGAEEIKQSNKLNDLDRI